jgi:hypothetical protein
LQLSKYVPATFQFSAMAITSFVLGRAEEREKNGLVRRVATDSSAGFRALTVQV